MKITRKQFIKTVLTGMGIAIINPIKTINSFSNKQIKQKQIKAEELWKQTDDSLSKNSLSRIVINENGYFGYDENNRLVYEFSNRGIYIEGIIETNKMEDYKENIKDIVII